MKAKAHSSMRGMGVVAGEDSRWGGSSKNQDPEFDIYDCSYEYFIDPQNRNGRLRMRGIAIIYGK